MKRLFVGCRVRIVCPRSPRHGWEARIIGCDVPGIEFGRRYVGFWVDLPGKTTAADGRWIFEADELERIIGPDLNQVIEWSDMADLWTPSGVEA